MEYISLKELLEGTHASIDFKDHFNPTNPKINIDGIGKMDKKSLENLIINKLEELYTDSKKKNFTKLFDEFNTKSILYHYIQALKDIEEEQKSAKGKRYSSKFNKEQDQKRITKKELKQNEEEIEEKSTVFKNR